METGCCNNATPSYCHKSRDDLITGMYSCTFGIGSLNLLFTAVLHVVSICNVHAWGKFTCTTRVCFEWNKRHGALILEGFGSLNLLAMLISFIKWQNESLA